MKVFVVLLAVIASSYADDCPDEWESFEANCYRFYGERVSWQAAETACTTENAHLASIHSDAENSFVFDLFMEVYGDVQDPDGPGGSIIKPLQGTWIGLHQENNNDPWTNTDGTTSEYTNWHDNQPNDETKWTGNTQECVHIWRKDESPDKTMKWNDNDCEYHLGFAYTCKKPETVESDSDEA